MVTVEEREEIINAAVEKALLMLPETIGSLMSSQAALMKANKEFFAKHPEFAQHRDVVQAVLEKVDGEDTLADYQDKLAKAVPLVRERLQTMQKLDLAKVDKRVDRNFSDIDTSGSNGVL